jgi:excisionase family DNA binding protein
MEENGIAYSTCPGTQSCLKAAPGVETMILLPMSSEGYWKKLAEMMERLLNEKLKPGGFQAPPPGMTSRPLLSIKEVCDLFQITKPTIYEWTRHGKLKPYKVRARVYFLMADIEALIKQSSPTGPTDMA